MSEYKGKLIVMLLVLIAYMPAFVAVNSHQSKVTHVTWAPNDAKADGLEPFNQTSVEKCPNLPDGTPQIWCCGTGGTNCKCVTTCSGSWPW